MEVTAIVSSYLSISTAEADLTDTDWLFAIAPAASTFGLHPHVFCCVRIANNNFSLVQRRRPVKEGVEQLTLLLVVSTRIRSCQVLLFFSLFFFAHTFHLIRMWWKALIIKAVSHYCCQVRRESKRRRWLSIAAANERSWVTVVSKAGKVWWSPRFTSKSSLFWIGRHSSGDCLGHGYQHR